MKSIAKILGLITVAVIFSINVNAQCNADALAQNCVPKLQDGFTFLKTFKVDGLGGAKNKVEYSYVFSKDTQYFIPELYIHVMQRVFTI